MANQEICSISFRVFFNVDVLKTSVIYAENDRCINFVLFLNCQILLSLESAKIIHRVPRQKQLLLVKVPCYNAMVGGLSYTQIKDILYCIKMQLLFGLRYCYLRQNKNVSEHCLFKNVTILTFAWKRNLESRS